MIVIVRVEASDPSNLIYSDLALRDSFTPSSLSLYGSTVSLLSITVSKL